MKTTFEFPVVNRLIAGLPDVERDELLSRCELVDLAFGEVLCAQHHHYTHAWFPLTAFISVVASVMEHPPMEICMVGLEGMLGVTLLLSVDQVPHQAITKGAGRSLRISTSALYQVLSDSPVLLRSLQRYGFRLMMQVAQTTVCTRFHLVEARLARWLLMTHDRAQKDHFDLTHQFLADMLGVRRSAVTIASGILQQSGLIVCSRGRISILDRPGLEAAACECYAAENFRIEEPGIGTCDHAV